MKKIFSIFLIISVLTISLVGCKKEEEVFMGKPVIYLYPEIKTDISVKLDLDGDLIYTYPQYNGEWNVTAYPDGKIIDKKDNKEYSYLFWEGLSDVKFDYSKGFVVKAEDTEKFLTEKLSYMGLIPKEYNDFIVYWAPLLKQNKYNLITFQDKIYTDTAKLNITPKPDSELRIFMAAKPLNNAIKIQEQELVPFERKGFSVIEWGGTIE